MQSQVGHHDCDCGDVDDFVDIDGDDEVDHFVDIGDCDDVDGFVDVDVDEDLEYNQVVLSKQMNMTM